MNKRKSTFKCEKIKKQKAICVDCNQECDGTTKCAECDKFVCDDDLSLQNECIQLCAICEKVYCFNCGYDYPIKCARCGMVICNVCKQKPEIHERICIECGNPRCIHCPHIYYRYLKEPPPTTCDDCSGVNYKYRGYFGEKYYKALKRRKPILQKVKKRIFIDVNFNFQST